MINAWEYAYDNYDGENESSVVDSIVEQLIDELYDACDVNEGIPNEELYAKLSDDIRDLVLENINFNEIKHQMENDRDEYLERQRELKGGQI